MALAQDTQRVFAHHTAQTLGLPAAAGARLWVGTLVATNGSGLAVPASDTAGLVVQGVCRAGIDNQNGADGTLGVDPNYLDAVRFVRVDAQGEWLFAVDGATPTPGSTALVVDDETVSVDATTHNIVAGKFTRPYDSTHWFVDVERR